MKLGPLPANPLPTLADEILTVLPDLIARHPDGLAVTTIIDRLFTDALSVRTAFKRLNADGKADLLRRRHSRELFLVPLGYRVDGLRICANCGVVFDRKKPSERRTCARSCAVALAWRDTESAATRRTSISKAHSTPEALARIAAHNGWRWSRPGERERMSEQNRREWADPVKATLRSQGIRGRARTPEQRAKASKIKKAQWQDPAFRRATVAGIRRSKRTPEARAQFSKLLRERWAHPEKRKIYLAGVRKTAAKMTEGNRGKKQSPEHVRKRLDARRDSGKMKKTPE